MEIDKTTLNDLSIFNREEDFSVFQKLNNTSTSNGREQLRKNISTPLPSIKAITEVQQTVQLILAKESEWPKQITNGTIMVVERFYEYTFDRLPNHVSSFAAISYKFMHGPDYSLIKYSIIHCFDFIKGIQLFTQQFLKDDCPAPLKKLLEAAKKSIDSAPLKIIAENNKAADLTVPQQLQLAQYIRYHYKQHMLALVGIHAQLDAWYGMAKAVVVYNLVFPVFIKSPTPVLEAKGLYHILLKEPISYDMQLSRENNFVFLTGANMAGKSTFIKAVGSAVFLAHIGMGVPAESMELSLFDGLVSNINVVDNVVKGESYFYNEVQRIKNTILKITDGRKWLVLIDELFKGTNIEDAMKCSTVVIEGLIKIQDSLFILSTHLYEISNALQKHPNIDFKYFETTVENEQLTFSYQLKDGVSNDRLGYLILKNEKVIELLEGL